MSYSLIPTSAGGRVVLQWKYLEISDYNIIITIPEDFQNGDQEYDSTNTVTGAPFTFVRSRGNPLAPTASVSGDEITTFDFIGFDGTNGYSANKIRSTVDGAVSTSIVPGRLEFLTTSSAGVQAVTLTVSSTAVTSTVPVKLAVYADATARNAAITSPTAGMIVFNTTGTKFQGYTGSAWVDLN